MRCKSGPADVACRTMACLHASPAAARPHRCPLHGAPCPRRLLTLPGAKRRCVAAAASLSRPVARRAAPLPADRRLPRGAARSPGLACAAAASAAVAALLVRRAGGRQVRPLSNTCGASRAAHTAVCHAQRLQHAQASGGAGRRPRALALPPARAVPQAAVTPAGSRACRGASGPAAAAAGSAHRHGACRLPHQHRRGTAGAARPARRSQTTPFEC